MATRKKKKAKRKTTKRKKTPAKSHRSVAALEKALVACKKSKRKKASKKDCSCDDKKLPSLPPTKRYAHMSHHGHPVNSNRGHAAKTLLSAGNIDWN